MKHIFLSVLLTLGLCTTGFACSCVYIPTFCETVTFGNGLDSNDLVIHADVVTKSGTEMDVRIIDILYGSPRESVLSIPNGNGADCRVMIEQFDVGKRYIFNLRDLHEYGYLLSECGVTFLPVNGTTVSGPIAPGVSSIDLYDFHALQDCGDLGEPQSSGAEITVQPTVTTQAIQIHSSRDLEDVDIELYDMTGRLVFLRKDAALFADLPMRLESRDIPSGCYAIVIRSAAIHKTVRILIMS